MGAPADLLEECVRTQAVGAAAACPRGARGWPAGGTDPLPGGEGLPGQGHRGWLLPPGREQTYSADAWAEPPGACWSTCAGSSRGGAAPALFSGSCCSCDALLHGGPCRVQVRPRRGELSAPFAGRRRGPRDAYCGTPCPAQHGAVRRDRRLSVVRGQSILHMLAPLGIGWREGCYQCGGSSQSRSGVSPSPA